MAFQMIIVARSYKQRASSLETLQPIESSGRLVNLLILGVCKDDVWILCIFPTSSPILFKYSLSQITNSQKRSK
jgi:hypothetical protein